MLRRPRLEMCAPHLRTCFYRAAPPRPSATPHCLGHDAATRIGRCLAHHLTLTRPSGPPPESVIALGTVVPAEHMRGGDYRAATAT